MATGQQLHLFEPGYRSGSYYTPSQPTQPAHTANADTNVEAQDHPTDGQVVAQTASMPSTYESPKVHIAATPVNRQPAVRPTNKPPQPEPVTPVTPQPPNPSPEPQEPPIVPDPPKPEMPQPPEDEPPRHDEDS